MKIKALILASLLLSAGCANIASPTNYIVIIKLQSGEDHDMYGSKLEDIAKGLTQEAGDVTIPLK